MIALQCEKEPVRPDQVG